MFEMKMFVWSLLVVLVLLAVSNFQQVSGFESERGEIDNVLFRKARSGGVEGNANILIRKARKAGRLRVACDRLKEDGKELNEMQKKWCDPENFKMKYGEK